MMAHTVDSYRELAEITSPATVSQYLAAQGWELESHQTSVKQVWRLADEQGHLQGRVLLPLASDFADYRERLRDALLALGTINDWDASKLYQKLAVNRADMFFVRLDQEMLDESIPLDQARDTIEALRKMLLAAATTAANPYHSHRGRRPASVTEFLDDGVRLGHTRHGSFVFTVVARLGEKFRYDSNLTPSENFPRTVMRTLAAGLQATRDIANSWNSRVLDSPGAMGLSTNLVESLEEMTKPQGLRALDLSFAWSESEDLPNVGRENIVLDREAIAKLPILRERLGRNETPPQRTTLIGKVHALARENQGLGGEESGAVQIKADIDGSPRNVHVTLSGQDHDWAVIAYSKNLPLEVTGELTLERRTWRLQGDIEVDPSNLERPKADKADPAAD